MYTKFSKYIFATIFLLALTGCGKNVEDRPVEKTSILTTIPQDGAEAVDDRHVLFVRRQDKALMDDSDKSSVQGISGIEGVQLYGGSARVNYFFQEGTDYCIGNEEQLIPMFYAENGMDSQKFMLSADNLSKDDLATGDVPQALNEIAVYTSDQSLIGKTLSVYCYNYMDMCDATSQNRIYPEIVSSFNEGVYIEKDMVITGILKEKTEQVYFSQNYCEMMSKVMTDFVWIDAIETLYVSGYNDGIRYIDGKIGPAGNVKIYGEEGDGGPFVFNNLPWKDAYEQEIQLSKKDSQEVIIYLDETLEKQKVGLPEDMMRIIDFFVQEETEDETMKYGIYDFMGINFYETKDTIPEGAGEDWIEDLSSAIGYSSISIADNHRGKGRESYVKTTYQRISETLNKSGRYTLAVNQELFDQIYDYDGSRAMAVYVEDGKEESVMAELSLMGYVAYQCGYEGSW